MNRTKMLNRTISEYNEYIHENQISSEYLLKKVNKIDKKNIHDIYDKLDINKRKLNYSNYSENKKDELYSKQREIETHLRVICERTDFTKRSGKSKKNKNKKCLFKKIIL
jgi:hypothetical protein